jgi:hypothetical protein
MININLFTTCTNIFLKFLSFLIVLQVFGVCLHTIACSAPYGPFVRSTVPTGTLVYGLRMVTLRSGHNNIGSSILKSSLYV